MTTTASGSFSWATSRPDLFSVDLAGDGGRPGGLPPLPRAWLAGRDRDALGLPPFAVFGQLAERGGEISLFDE